ncbi:uncharacterized protein LOC122650592 [Telopea speciosissima]|uniref:uncharacterized protein LOC122650592 n=1 Tax=Telopea speciosissima TaxID=54955 RepID=UPI001CC7DBB4|nr:uncharacterized protein LOC122650592 [Telopea speciosissima]
MPSKRPKLEMTISFIEADLEGISLAHNDALVVQVEIASRPVRQVLIDTEASVDLMSLDAYRQFGFGDDALKHEGTSLHGFSRASATNKGSIDLLVTFGQAPCQMTIKVKFMVVRSVVAFNATLGCPSLTALHAIISPVHLKMKFPTENGIEEIRGDQKKARECYATFVKQNKRNVQGMAMCVEHLLED